MEMAVDVPNSEARGRHGLTLKKPQSAPSVKRTEKTSPAEHSRQSEAQNVGAGGDRDVLTPAGRVRHGSRLDGVVGRNVPQALSVLLIDAHQIPVRIGVSQDAARR